MYLTIKKHIKQNKIQLKILLILVVFLFVLLRYNRFIGNFLGLYEYDWLWAFFQTALGIIWILVWVRQLKLALLWLKEQVNQEKRNIILSEISLIKSAVFSVSLEIAKKSQNGKWRSSIYDLNVYSSFHNSETYLLEQEKEKLMKLWQSTAKKAWLEFNV